MTFSFIFLTPRFREGEVAGLTFQNPFPGSDLMLVWGNNESPLQRQLKRQVRAACLSQVHIRAFSANRL